MSYGGYGGGGRGGGGGYSNGYDDYSSLYSGGQSGRRDYSTAYSNGYDYPRSRSCSLSCPRMTLLYSLHFTGDLTFRFVFCYVPPDLGPLLT